MNEQQSLFKKSVDMLTTVIKLEIHLEKLLKKMIGDSINGCRWSERLVETIAGKPRTQGRWPSGRKEILAELR